MGYTLGLDLGTTSSAAAINDGSSVRMLSVDHSAAVIPSVVHVDGDGTVLVGSAAERRAISDPSGVAREFKRRFGDPQPLFLSGTPVSANDLMLEVAESLVSIATDQLGAAPTEIVVCHPANWGSYKVGLLSDTLANSSLAPHRLISEPEAAAIYYASQERVGDGEVIAVYDLGGGTFDAVVLRKTTEQASGWEILGEPRGIERLGGIDFDLAVLHHVIDVLSLDLDTFDSEDAANQTAMFRFRGECREAKHALSSDVTATVPVLLPGYNETVRITRREFEALIDPAISRTIDTLEVAITTTGLELDAIDRVLLVGGSTRVPLVAERLAAATNRPIKSDAHPKHAVALGAAALSGLASATTAAPPAADAPIPPFGTPEQEASERSQPESNAPEPTVPASPGPTKTAAPSHTDLYNLPHIDEEPLPDFMKGRAAGAAAVASSTAGASTPRPEAPPGPSQAAPTPLDPPSLPLTMPADTRQPPTSPTNVGPVIIDEQLSTKRRSGGLVFLVSFIVVAVALTIVLFLIEGGDDTATPADDTASTTAPENADQTTSTVDETPTFETSCSSAQLPDPDVRYRVTMIPDTFDEPTLNGRNVPSTVSFNDVASRPITAFPEFSELELTYTGCEVAENGRVWWAVSYTGPDVAGGTFSGIVWSSTKFIEPIPT